MNGVAIHLTPSETDAMSSLRLHTDENTSTVFAKSLPQIASARSKHVLIFLHTPSIELFRKPIVQNAGSQTHHPANERLELEGWNLKARVRRL